MVALRQERHHVSKDLIQRPEMEELKAQVAELVTELARERQARQAAVQAAEQAATTARTFAEGAQIAATHVLTPNTDE